MRVDISVAVNVYGVKPVFDEGIERFLVLLGLFGLLLEIAHSSLVDLGLLPLVFTVAQRRRGNLCKLVANLGERSDYSQCDDSGRVSEGSALGGRHCADPDLDVLNQLELLEEEAGIVDGFYQGLEEASDRLFEGSSTFSFGNDGVLGYCVLETLSMGKGGWAHMD